MWHVGPPEKPVVAPEARGIGVRYAVGIVQLQRGAGDDRGVGTRLKISGQPPGGKGQESGAVDGLPQVAD